MTAIRSKATHGVPDRTLRRYKGECDETLAGTNAKRKKWKRLEAAPSVDPMEVGRRGPHAAIAKKKKDELERAAAKMRARVEAYETVWKEARWRGGCEGPPGASRLADSSSTAEKETADTSPSKMSGNSRG